MIKKSLVLCSGCGLQFEKETKYVKQSEKKGRRHFCSLKCQGINEGYNRFPGDSWNKSEKNTNNLKNICSNRSDEYTGFRTLLASCKKRNKECDVDLPYLKCLWEKQEGKCAVTGVELKLESSGNKNYQASIDRIDSSKGYIKGNIRYTSVSVNWLKSNLDDEHLKEFFNICKNSWILTE